MKHSNRYNNNFEKLNREKEYSLEEAVELLTTFNLPKFDESVELAINLGVDPKHADQIVRGMVALPNGIGKDVKLILVTRRLTRRTGVSQFVEIYKKVRPNLSYDTTLLIGGKGDQFYKIKEMEDYHVKVLGWISEKEIGDYIKSANIYVLPSLDLEGFGYVILESLACGVPTIVSESAGGGTDFIKQLDQDLVFKFTLKDISKVLNYALKKTENINNKVEEPFLLID